MKKIIFFSIAALLASGSFAQFGPAQQEKNALLNASFWQGKPDVTAVKAEIAKGNNPLEANRMNFDPIVFAGMNGASGEVISFLLEQNGANVNKITHEGRTYLIWSAMRGNLEAVNALIKKGADVNIIDEHGGTALSFAAASENSLPLLETLVKAGANLNTKYQNGANLLLMSVGTDKDLKVTDYLISKGLSLQSKDDKGATAFDYAAKSGNLEGMKLLRERGVKYTNSALLMAAEGTRRGTTPLPVFEYLVGLGIKPTLTDAENQNVLHFITRKPNQSEAIQYFISKGVSLDHADNDGNTPFMNAAGSSKDAALIRSLLPKIKDINKKNKDGASALALAVQNNSGEIVTLLLDKGADIQTKDVKGNSLAFYLLQSFRIGRGGFAPQMEGGKDEFASKLALLQSKGVNFAAPQEDGSNLIFLATAKNSLPLLKKIEGLGIDVNAKNAEGLTALQKAALIAKDDSVLKYLLSIGADKTVKNDMDETAYDLAKENEFLTKNNVSVDFLK